MLLFAGVYSLMTFVMPAVFVAEGFEVATGRSLATVDDQGYVAVLLSAQRHVAAFATASTIAGFFFLYVGFRKGESWAWWALLVVGVISWGWGLVENIRFSSSMNIILHSAGAFVYLVGMMLPVGVFFGKKA
jgi:hypothetical protein